MTLNKKGVTKYLWNSLQTILKDPIFKDYYLVGGTALSLHIGHRQSEDIDLFTNKEMKKELLLDFIKNKIDKKAHILNNGISIFQLYCPSGRLKIDFVKEPYQNIEPLISTDGIRLIDLNDLSAMKISAAGTRGTEAKDFVDLYYLLKLIPINKIIENFKKRFKTDNVLHYVRSAMYFDDIKKESWEALRPLNEIFDPKTIKKTLIKEISAYERSQLLRES